ncbi:MAG: DUF5666 domain-containing protein, partial [Planctomycetota bacterium]|nr:DUF5666 domain-containing protein [Planctomycetota bacterium]
ARPAANLLTVQGLSVEIDDRTVYGSGLASADSLLIGDLLEVWGFVKGPGLVRATRIERESSLSEIEIVGIVSNVDTGADTFEIGAQTIDYSGADMSDVPGGDPANGDLVSVEGAAALGGGGEVVATSVELLDLEDAPDNDDTSIEGFVTALQSSTRFELGGVVVETTAQTEYVGGVALDVVLGAELEVHGSLAAGVLTARRIEFEGSVEIEGEIAGNLLSIQGLPGLVIQVDGLTEFDGDAASLADIALGDHLKLDARIVGGSTVVAIEVEEGDADTTISLQGPVAAMPAPADPLFSILGVVVDTSTIAAGKFEGPDGAPLARGTFFALLVPGRLVEVKGDLVGGHRVWDEAELEDE